ncbi:MAG: hypothetical protein ABS920_11730 [Sporosarcina sp.]
MKVKIAVIGSNDFCRRTEQLVGNRKDIELNCYRYDEPSEAPSLIKTLTPSDAILFSGSLPYFYSKKVLDNLSIPAVYLQQDETAVAITLLKLSSQGLQDLSRISIDVRKHSNIQRVLNDLNQKIEFPYIHLLQDEEMIGAITSYHQTLFLQGKTEMAITSVHAVFEQLQQQNIPACKMIDPESTILRCIDQAKQQALLHKSQSAQIAVGIAQATSPATNIETAITTISSIMQARWNLKDERYTLYTSMGNIESALKRKEFLSTFETLANKAKMAFGYGESIIDATANANIALNLIQHNDGHSFYIVDSNKRLYGPFPKSVETIEMKNIDPELVKMADKTKLSPANISKLMHYSQTRQTKQFTANDLSLYLDVSRRTAERTLKKLVEFDYVKIVGEEMTYRQGRPRALYEFNFHSYR